MHTPHSTDTTASAKPPSFLTTVKRIKDLTRTIRRDGLAAFEMAEASYAEVQQLRAVLDARIAGLRRRTA